MAVTKKDTEVPIDLDIPDNYVSHTLKTVKPLPPIQFKNLHKELNYLSCIVIIATPLAGIIGASQVSLQWRTALWAVVYYFCTGLGMTFFAPHREHHS